MDSKFQSLIRQRIEESLQLKQQLLSDAKLINTLERMSQLVIEAFRADKKVLFCGNGGSAADAQHLATELAGRFYLDRPALFAEALPVNVPFVTAISNDYDYSYSIARLVESKGRPGDVLIALSTSGQSPNILKALEAAETAQMLRLGFTGKSGGSMPALCNHCLIIPNN
ncbi:MAG: SIS domain-containing protein, partial [Bacteroidota bacterium]